MVIGITGRRPQWLEGQEKNIEKWLETQFDKLNPDNIISGMAQGADQIAAWVAHDKGIKYRCYFPYRKKLHAEQQFLADEASYVYWMKNKYEGPQDYIERDKKIVDDCDLLLAIWDGVETGGTWQTIKYAKEKRKEIIYYRIDEEKKKDGDF